MACPPEISRIILEVLQAGILRIRGMAWSDQARRCALEADHLHNLPPLLADFSPDRLRYYWEVERISFLRQSSPEEVETFQPLWRQLEDYLGAMNRAQGNIAPSKADIGDLARGPHP